MHVHVPTRSLLLQADDPFMVRDLLPKSRLVDHPDYNVALKLTAQSAKVLRNIGIEAPHPIKALYNWPGKYQPFKHQYAMSEFLATNKRCFNLSEMGCVDAATEYLSPTGWWRIDQYAGGPVAQYVPETGAAEFVEPTEYVKLPCETMIRIKTKYGLDQLLSPEHRVLLEQYGGGRREVVPAVELLRRHEDWVAGGNMGRHPTRLAYSHCGIPNVFSVPGGAGIDLTDDQLRLQVAVIADGSFDSRRLSTTVCTVNIKKARKKTRLRMLLAAAGISAHERSNDTRTAQGYTVFSFPAPWRTKEFDARFWEATPAQLRIICDEVMHWDGSIAADKPSQRFSSYVKASADFVQYAFCATGRTARLTSHRRGDNEVEHMVQVRAKGTPLMLCSRTSEGERQPVMSVELSPDGFKYCFMVPSTFLIFRRNGCVFASGNTGKTAAVLWAADYLMQQGLVDRALILSPLSTIERVWLMDVFDVLMHRTAGLVYGTREKRKYVLSQKLDFYIANHDVLGISEVVQMIRERPDINLLIVDEASMFRNADTKKYKALAKLIASRPDLRIWLITGTPCPNAPTDAWALAKLVSPDRVPKYFGAFKRTTMTQISQFKWLPRIDAFNIAYEAMQPAVRFKKSECLDLPPMTFQDRQCEMSPEQRTMFTAMKNQMQTEAKTTQITAVNAADKINKIRQILCGSVKDPVGDTYVSIPHGPRYEVLKECIEQASAKVIVVCPFKGIIYDLEKELTDDGFSVGLINGDVSPKRRDAIIRAFKETPDPHVLLCHPKVASHGLNLTEADTLIFYAPIYSNDEFGQVIERFNRAGQKHKMTVVKIAAHPAEWSIYQMLADKAATQQSILDLYKAITS